MAKSKSTPAKGRSAKQARRPPPRDGELEDAALDRVAGGAGTSVAEMAAMASETQFDLQDTLTQQQQAFQTVSKISKAAHATATAIIKNLKG
jgi:hypothetical protein